MQDTAECKMQYKKFDHWVCLFLFFLSLSQFVAQIKFVFYNTLTHFRKHSANKRNPNPVGFILLQHECPLKTV